MISDDPFRYPKGVVSRWASAENPEGLKGAATRGNDGRKRAPFYTLPPGGTLELAESSGSPGMVRRIYITLADRGPQILRGIRIDFYWDGAKTPAVSSPLGDFFCQGLGKTYAFSNCYFASPEGKSFLCFVPMPFRSSMRILLTNESGMDPGIIAADVSYTLGDEIGDDFLYFHCHWRRENPTVEGVDYAFLPKVAGKGRLVGVNIGVAADTKTYFGTWWGEGVVKIFVDGDEAFPSFAGTGSEDYYGAAFAPNGQFSLPYSGCPFVDFETVQYCFYRLHVPDPIYFSKDIRAAIQQIGATFLGKVGDAQENEKSSREAMALLLGSGLSVRLGADEIDLQKRLREDKGFLFERQDDVSSCAYFYLDRPENGLPALADVKQRIRPSHWRTT